ALSFFFPVCYNGPVFVFNSPNPTLMNVKTIALLILVQLYLIPSSYSQTLSGNAASAKVKDADLVVLDSQRKSISFVRLKSTAEVPVSQSGSWLRTAYSIPLSTELRKVKQD